VAREEQKFISKENRMKRLVALALGVTVGASLAATACGQGNPRGTAKLTLNGATVSVDYGKPSLKGRAVKDMLAQVAVGDFWRLGADKSTTFKTTGDLTFGDVKVPAGEYSLWAKKEAENKWSLVFNKQHGQWGTDHDPSQDFASVPLKMESGGESAEQVTITLEKAHGGGEISIQWGDMKLSADFTAK
jgi:hypothetical protein